MAYSQGAVVVATDPFGDNPKRPYLVLSNDTVPFHGQEYVAAVVTTTARDEAVELTDDRFERGRLPRTSYVSPWSVVTLKDWMVDKQPAEATDATVDEVRRELNTYLHTG
ncbi:type II toxin-antitoxin system PemK/MazF family toxin [Halosimplex halophilum]|uniref:type II toxin-antitoxin system PemK/MazF family toxin n=1 Tax=Halosimplex halophilum TaxID=2559572 RepID=UPI00107F888F|nr:type II toxin-antitoxin system PemK/MazF family toxin [Halosimplex halophilum]